MHGNEKKLDRGRLKYSLTSDHTGGSRSAFPYVPTFSRFHESSRKIGKTDYKNKTRMHSSSLTVCWSVLPGGGLVPGGGRLLGGVCCGGVLPAQGGSPCPEGGSPCPGGFLPPCEQNHTHV